MEVRNLLDSWNLSELVPIFEEHSIDEMTFKQLSSNKELIKELIPKIGIRLKFLEKFENFIENQQIKSLDDNITIEIINVDDRGEVANLDSSSSISDISSGDDPNMTCIRQHATFGLSAQELTNAPFFKYNATCAKKTGFEDILNSTTRGKLIMFSYKKNGKLLPEYRHKLVELLLDAELEQDMDRRISIHRFEEMAAAIVGLFPTEFTEVYFRKTRKRSGGYVGGGKLFCKYYNLRKQLKLNGLIKNKSNSDINCSDDESPTAKEKDSKDDEYIKESIEWLKHNTSPYSQVESRWRHTCKKRKTILTSTPINEYMKLFPILQINGGYNMFNIDFEERYKENDIFYLNWIHFATKLLKYAKANCSKDKTVSQIVKEIENDNIGEDGRNNRILKMLPYMINPVAVTRKWKPSKTEVQEAFIMHIQSLGDLQNIIEKRKQKLDGWKLTFQPTPIIIGEDLDNITASYVRVDNTLYMVESPLKAVEVTFKAIHALNALYPPEAEQVWLVIQQALFNLKTNYDKQFVSVNLLLPHLIIDDSN